MPLQQRENTMNLLAPPSDFVSASLERYPGLLRRVHPLKSAHLRSLPRDIAALSLLLTERRSEMEKPYWMLPAFQSAYLWYFLPWNLYRLAWLLPALELPLEDGDRVLDLGSGPLTLLQALWLTRPDLREKHLSLICSDAAARPLETGKALFEALTKEDIPGECPWRLRTPRISIETALDEAWHAVRHPRTAESARLPRLILAGNVVNELAASRRLPLETRLRGLVWRAARALAPGGRILFLEPGNRLGGRLASRLRQAALDLGLCALSPCTHQKPCPALRPGAPLWCHFNLDASHAPRWLQELSAKAGLAKEQASLSFLLLQRPGTLEALPPEADFLDAGGEEPEKSFAPRPDHGDFPSGPPGLARVLSDPFPVPDAAGLCRYACAACGLLLLEDAARLPWGAAVTPVLSQRRRDKKTGIPLLSFRR